MRRAGGGSRVVSVRSCLRPVLRVPLCGNGFRGGEVGQCEHRQGDVGVPGPIVADLVVVEPGLVLGLLERFLYMPAGSGGPGQVDRPGRGGSVSDVVGPGILKLSGSAK